ncbi:hypothetical protein FQN50_003511 [Emmonsiellopsis sp. PD_5]|nr:hypothetical protein FQN50_003511 [Emmonsiellopsis sp. PD_5]
MADRSKRPRGNDGAGQPSKRNKVRHVAYISLQLKGHQWYKSNTRQWTYRQVIERGDAGMFDLESQNPSDERKDEGSASDDDDIEAQIKKEVEGMKPQKKSNKPFQAVKLDIPCRMLRPNQSHLPAPIIHLTLNRVVVSFIKIDKALDPVQIAHRLCVEARANPDKKRSRWIQRMTPITLTQKVLGGGLEELSREVLKPHFHSGGPPKKYAIRPSVRNNSEWNRDSVIKLVAGIVGPEHPVDLKNFDALILVDVVQNICGMSVVGRDYEELKRYNLSEIYEPTPKPKIAPAPAAEETKTEAKEESKPSEPMPESETVPSETKREAKEE